MAQSIQESIGKASADWPPSSDSSDQGLADAAEAIGLADGSGGYGARGATAASGATGQQTGDKGTVYPINQLATGPGGVRIKLRASVTILAGAGTGQIDGVWDVDATDANSLGAKGNLLSGVVCTYISPPATSDSTFILTSNINGGAMAVLGQDAEAGPQLLTRIQNKMQRPPNGGNGTDYKGWAEDARDSANKPVSSAVLLAFDYPHYYGVGSPMVCETAAGSGQSRRPGEAIRAAVESYINGSTTSEGQRPVSHDCTVTQPYMPDERALVIRCRCVPSLAKFAFDWARGTTTHVVIAAVFVLPVWASTAGANLVFSIAGPAVGTGTVPQSLKDAIDAGTEPRIFVHLLEIVTGTLLGPVIPELLTVHAYKDTLGVTSLGVRTTSVPSWQAYDVAGGISSNEVYSAGPISSSVSTAILGAVDVLGPSRVTGLADPAVLWGDTLGIAQITGAALTTLDEDKATAMVSRCLTAGVLSAANATHIRIGGLGAAGVDDVQATDTTVNGPELLYAGRILVTD